MGAKSVVIVIIGRFHDVFLSLPATES